MRGRPIQFLSAAALLVSACSDGAGLFATDNDSDGVAAEDDCDDDDPSIYPGADEVWDDGIDQDCDGVADAEDADCSADLTVTLPDESTTTLDGCMVWDFDASFEYDPDDPPEVIDFTLALGGTDEADFDCQVDLVQPGVCGPGYYRHGFAATTTLVLLDCSGVEDAYENTFEASSGYLRIDTIDAGNTPGSFAGEPLVTTLEGYLHVTTPEGIDLRGDLSLTRVQIAPDGEEQDDCIGVDGDLDGDGFIDQHEFDGDDCADADPDTFPGAADADDPSACMTDVDNDGWGATSPADGVEPGRDCDDRNWLVHPTDSDGDGQVDVCGWQVLVSGHNHTCALDPRGGIDCWGSDQYDQLSGTPTDIAYTRLDANGNWSCALDPDGALACWGSDSSDKLSDMPTGGGFVSLGLGVTHGCALDAAGALTCWGRSQSNVDMPTGSGFLQVGGGSWHSCGLDGDGQALCWGQGLEMEASLASVPSGTYEQLSCGDWHCCARTATGTISCWGNDDEGQVSSTPRGGGYTHVDAGPFHNCALSAAGGITCWGLDDEAQSSGAPDDEGFVALAAGESHACAVDAYNDIRCWGSNYYGQLSEAP